MNNILLSYFFHLLLFMIGICIFFPISFKQFKKRGVQLDEKPVYANNLIYKIYMWLLYYGITILVSFYFIMHLIDLPIAISKNYKIVEGKVEHVYRDELEVDGKGYTTNTNGIDEGNVVRIYYLPVSKYAPKVQVIE